jgi:hypothetical protein
MKNTLAAVAVAFVSAVLLVAPVQAGQQGVGVGVRQHVGQPDFEKLPFGDGDVSYGLDYEYHEQNSMWQIALGYAPEVTGTNDVDYAVTPQLSLLLKDGMWRGGLGILDTYSAGLADAESRWSSLYWQFLVGVTIPVGSLSLNVSAHYVFDNWKHVRDFDLRDVEFGAWLSLMLK